MPRKSTCQKITNYAFAIFSIFALLSRGRGQDITSNKTIFGNDSLSNVTNNPNNTINNTMFFDPIGLAKTANLKQRYQAKAQPIKEEEKDPSDRKEKIAEKKSCMISYPIDENHLIKSGGVSTCTGLDTKTQILKLGEKCSARFGIITTINKITAQSNQHLLISSNFACKVYIKKPLPIPANEPQSVSIIINEQKTNEPLRNKLVCTVELGKYQKNCYKLEDKRAGYHEDYSIFTAEEKNEVLNSLKEIAHKERDLIRDKTSKNSLRLSNIEFALSLSLRAPGNRIKLNNDMFALAIDRQGWPVDTDPTPNQKTPHTPCSALLTDNDKMHSNTNCFRFDEKSRIMYLGNNCEVFIAHGNKKDIAFSTNFDCTADRLALEDGTHAVFIVNNPDTLKIHNSSPNDRIIYLAKKEQKDHMAKSYRFEVANDEINQRNFERELSATDGQVGGPIDGKNLKEALKELHLAEQSNNIEEMSKAIRKVGRIADHITSMNIQKDIQPALIVHTPTIEKVTRSTDKDKLPSM